MDNAYHHTGYWRHSSRWQLAIVFSLDAPLTLTHTHTLCLSLASCCFVWQFHSATCLSCIKKKTDLSLRENVAVSLIGTFSRTWKAESLSCCVVYTDYSTECERREGQRHSQSQCDGRVLDVDLEDHPMLMKTIQCP